MRLEAFETAIGLTNVENPYVFRLRVLIYFTRDCYAIFHSGLLAESSEYFTIPCQRHQKSEIT
jgi:hypothetical protein